MRSPIAHAQSIMQARFVFFLLVMAALGTQNPCESVIGGSYCYEEFLPTCSSQDVL